MATIQATTKTTGLPTTEGRLASYTAPKCMATDLSPKSVVCIETAESPEASSASYDHLMNTKPPAAPPVHGEGAERTSYPNQATDDSQPNSQDKAKTAVENFRKIRFQEFARRRMIPDRSTLASSQHTEISYYTTSDEEDDEETGWVDSEDDNSEYRRLQATPSRLSVESPDASFTLAVRSMDEVSSLELDEELLDLDQTVDDISETSQNSSEDRRHRDHTDILQLRDVFMHSGKVQVSALKDPQWPSALRGVVEEEDESDGDDLAPAAEDDAKPDKYDLDSQVLLTERLSKSVNLQQSVIDTTEADFQSPISKVDFSESALAIPPELDLEKARIYLEQLAKGVPEVYQVPPIPFPRSATKRISSNSTRGNKTFLSRESYASSEYTEVLVLSDDEDGLEYSTGRSFGAVKARESAISYDYTEEVVNEEDEYEEEVTVDEDQEIVVQEVIEDEVTG